MKKEFSIMAKVVANQGTQEEEVIEVEADSTDMSNK
ncbi:hypothetical protein C5167_025984 [Papaver somniferum]|uniref:Uncharacterized protein n=1 Tax=Papaver somniferum TaxID=3469 RepID=A0A4Y7JWY1_PAPSO|nr:hypothetical protein C5167_025984 [Papaver somniferum]